MHRCILVIMPKFTIVVDTSSDEDEVIDLVSSDSSIEASIGGLSSGGASSSSLSSSSSSSSSFLPSWICFPDGRWLQVNNIFDECNGLNEETQATSDWYAELRSRWPQKQNSKFIIVDKTSNVPCGYAGCNILSRGTQSFIFLGVYWQFNT
jgi:hypothetical protein